MMVQERDATIGTLVKSIEMQLCPVVFGEESTRNSDILAHGAVEGAILQIAEQKNYGPSLSDLQGCCGPELAEVPLIRDVSLLPADVRDVVKRRRELRQNAHVECTQWFRALDADTQMQVLAGTLKKLKVKVQNQQQGDKATTPLPRGQRSLQTFFGSEKAIDRERASSVEPLAPRSYYETIFLPFHLRANTDMYRYQPPASFDSTALDKVLSCKAPTESHDQARDSLLQELQNAPREPPRLHAAAAPVCKGVEIDEAEVQLQRLRQMPMKLLHFHGSRRPDYWGTWSRSLCTVGGRRPFARDSGQLDYDVDSDAEWEDEDEGEELRSDDDDEGEGGEDDDDDDDEDDEDFDEVNGFVVGDRIPHSHSDLLLGEGSVDCESNDGSSESEFNSEDEEIEEINPEEEVCMDQMDVDEDCGLETPSMRRKSSRRAAKPSIESLVSE
ncbi:Chromatin assembly factor 1, subunit A, partial [Coemansia sp. RSA 2559]